MRIGASLPSKNPLKAAADIGAECVQIHLSAPRVWRAPIERKDASELATSSMIAAAHAAYLCNPASGDPAVREKTQVNLQATLDEAARCGVGGVVVHAGHAAGGGDMDDAITRWVTLASSLHSTVPLLIENTATGTTAPGRHLDNIARLFSALREAELSVPIGSCFDTCHAWAGDDAAALDAAAYVKGFARATGGIDLLHVNDSKDEAGAGRDRHTNIGAGEMGHAALRAMVTTAADLGTPSCVVETPSENDGHVRDMATLHEWLDG